MGLKHYAPKDYDCIVGVAVISGYGEDTMIGVEQTEDTFTVTAGADGEITRVKSHNRTHRVTLTLMQNSPSNEVLAALHQADISADGGAGVVTFLLRNKNGSTLIASAACWVVKSANVTLSKGAQGREWMIDLVDPSVFVGT
jgi:hypothetical protein